MHGAHLGFMSGPHSIETWLTPFRLRELEATADTVFAVDLELRLHYHNAGWSRFARENQGEPGISQRWGLGCQVMDAIPGVLRGYYQALLDEALAVTPGAAPLHHAYECSTPHHFRVCSLRLHRLRAGLLLVHGILLERPHDVRQRRPQVPSAGYITRSGHVQQCVHCRRVRLADGVERWDWVPAWVEQPPQRPRQGLCGFCFEYYYGAGTLDGLLARG